MDKAMHSEFEEAVRMSNKALDVPNADPDDNLRTVSRQFLRSIEQNQSLRSELQKQKELNAELVKGIESLVRLFYAGYTIYPKDLKSLIKKSKDS